MQVSLPQIQSALSNQAHTIHEQEQLLQTHLQANPAQDQGPFSWIKLIQQGTSLASLSAMGNLSHCLICATLGKVPLVAVPLPNAFNCTNLTPTGHYPSLRDIPLFTEPLNYQFPFCYSTPTPSSATSPYLMLPLITPLLAVSFGATAPFLNLSIPLPLSSVCLTLWFHD